MVQVDRFGQDPVAWRGGSRRGKSERSTRYQAVPLIEI